jgi:hypothetical protein
MCRPYWVFQRARLQQRMLQVLRRQAQLLMLPGLTLPMWQIRERMLHPLQKLTLTGYRTLPAV